MAGKKDIVIEKVLITDIGAQGKAIARVDNLVTFVSNALPGDVVDVRIARKRKSWQEGKAIRFHSYSPLRADPFCEHFAICGGCRWQDLQYAEQLRYKQKEVYDALKRIGRITDPPVRQIIAAEVTRFYRNKLEFTFSTRRWLETPGIAIEPSEKPYPENSPETPSGSASRITYDNASGIAPEHSAGHNALGFHIRGLFDRVVDLRNCYLQADPSNAIRLFVRDYALRNKLGFYDNREHTGLLRNLIIRTTTTGELMIIMVFSEDDGPAREDLLKNLLQEFPAINSIMYVINPKLNDSILDLPVYLFSGQDHLTENLDGLQYRIGPKSFFQTNTLQALKLYRLVKEFAGLSGTETVYDLYTGAGTIATFLAASAGKVTGIEYIAEAVSDARLNAEINGISNATFIAGDIKDVMDEAFIAEQGRPDVLITDPPRAGMHPDVIQAILRATPRRIIYVSCNPATQARDIALMSGKYALQFTQPIDMFPHTYHVENVAVLDIR